MCTEGNSKVPNQDEINFKEGDYRDRHRFWAGQTLSQFGNSNNFFTVIGFAILGYLVKEIDQLSNLSLTFTANEINPRATFLVIALSFTLLSLVSGTLTMLSRLYDLRLTRYINTIRIKSYSKKYCYDNNLPDEYIDIKGSLKFPNFQFELFKIFWESVLYNEYFLNENDLENKEIRHRKFKKLKERALMLGRFSWISFKWQIFWIALGIITFAIYWK